MNQTFSVLEVPLVHRNGTDGGELLRQVTGAGAKLWEAIKAMENAAPNARDYYPKEDGSFRRAEQEHRSRIAEQERLAQGYAPKWPELFGQDQPDI